MDDEFVANFDYRTAGTRELGLQLVLSAADGYRLSSGYAAFASQNSAACGAIPPPPYPPAGLQRIANRPRWQYMWLGTREGV